MKIEPHKSYRDETVTVINTGNCPVFVNSDVLNNPASRVGKFEEVPCLWGEDIKILIAAAQNILTELTFDNLSNSTSAAIEQSCAAIITLCSNTRIGDARADLDPTSPLNRLKRSEEILTEQGFTKMMKMPDGNPVWERGRWSADITDIPTTENQPPAFFIQYRGVL